jgi:hypothetical protein
MSDSNNANIRITEETIPAVTKHFAEVTVNGQSKGKREINGGPSLLEFCTTLASELGINSFNITLNGKPITSETQAKTPVAPGAQVGVSASDSRATRRDKAAPASDSETSPEDQTKTTNTNESTQVAKAVSEAVVETLAEVKAT